VFWNSNSVFVLDEDMSKTFLIQFRNLVSVLDIYNWGFLNGVHESIII